MLLVFARASCLTVICCRHVCVTLMFMIDLIFNSALGSLLFLFVLVGLSCVTLRLLQGVGRPDEVLACAEAGADLFESFFPYQVTERGCALCFSFDISLDPERAGRAPPAGVVNSCAEE